MEIYRDVSDWKGKAQDLLDALTQICVYAGSITKAQQIAKDAITKFNKSK